MERIKILIVEDQLLVAQDMAMKLEHHGLEVISIIDSGEAVLEFLQYNQPDMILMDIELSGAMDGISAASIIHDKYNIPLIYLTDHTDHRVVERAKKTHPVNFLSKPFNEAELLRAIEIAFYNAASNPGTRKTTVNEYVFLRIDSKEFIKIAYDDIIFLEADRAYCKLVTTDKIHILTNNMKSIHKQIDHPDFLRAHRRHVINVNKITAIQGNLLYLDQHHVTMSKEYRDNIINRLKFIK